MPRWTTYHTVVPRLRRRARDERGQALVEFAVVLPVLLLVIMGILYFGRYEDYSNQMTQLAEEGARWASVDSNPSTTQQLQTYLQSQAEPELQAGSNTVTPAQVYIYYPTGQSGTDGSVGSELRVCGVSTVTYPLLLGITSTTQTIAEYATMRIEVAQSSSGFTGWSPSNNSTSTTPSQCPTS